MVAQKQIHQALLWMKLDWLIDLCMSSEGQIDGHKETTQCESGSEEGSRKYMGDAWPPDGGRRVLNQTETNGVWETEGKKFRHMPADLSPWKKMRSILGNVCLCVCACFEGGSVCVTTNKDQEHSDITPAPSDCSLALQPLHVPLFNFRPCNLVTDREVWST